MRIVSIILTLLATLAPPALAQSAPAPFAKATTAKPQDPLAGDTLVIDGPPPPEPPAMISRDREGHATVRAIKLTEPLHVDGKLDEGAYSEYQPFGGFIQAAPNYLAPASENTDVWVMFDADNIYVAARLWDPDPPEKWVSNELRRDTNQIRENDHFGVMFDTYYDRRSGFIFYANPIGGFSDYSVVDEGGSNKDWNPVWNSRTSRFDGGWTIEMAIPFKTLRYRSGSNQVWGFQARRSIRHKNEWVYLTPVPRQAAGPQAFNRISFAGTLVGLDLPPASKNIELKPYAISRLETDNLRSPRVNGDLSATVGGDAKIGITANLTADLTFNTDFAQVEIDEQQVNLTRFSLFFPEKRDFFLEGRGIFDFARGGAGAGAGPESAQTSDMPYLFYSRRIGLDGSRVIPIDAGARLTGKVGAFSVGLVNIQARDVDRTLLQPAVPATNFSVVRVKRDILRRSTIGAMFTNRSKSSVMGGSNQAVGVDAAFSFYQNLTIGGYYAKTDTPGLAKDDDSYDANFNYMADRYGVKTEFLKIGDHFNPEVGFLRRDDFRKSSVSLRFSPRPKNRFKIVRKFTYQADLDYFENGEGRMESRQQSATFNAEFNNSDRFSIVANDNYELLVDRFALPVKRSVVIAPGAYNFRDVTVGYNFGQQRRMSGNVSVQHGEYYNGHLTVIGLSTARVSLLKQFSVEPRISINRVDLSVGKFTTTLLGSRADYGFSPRMFASALIQYSSSDRTFSSNLRYRWEYRPGSELFLVWTDEHDTWQ
ncbi:MAG TPA: DUF5916 domain-containing protein, partial [Vicinamibacterales bacterium]|nr:DUF5916 domain-containing protein [Vicinamibacterales bacterium]